MSSAAVQHARNFWLPLVIVGGLVVLTAWLGQLAQMPRPGGGNAAGHVPDYFVENLRVTAFDEAGLPRYRLSAVHMTHFSDDDTTLLEAPWFVREGTGTSHVVVRSLHGKVASKGEQVDFLGDVRMMRESGRGGAPMELATDYLRVMPDAERIWTDRTVVLKEGRNELRGGAMEADGEQRTLVLKGRVKGVYEIHR